MQDAAIAAEDRTFYSNSGIDPKGIVRAAFSNAQGNATQGASTITQQYVKILYLSQERTLSRKVKEAFLSLKVQQEQSKSAILEGYLNTIYFGRGAYGVQAAANAYFGKPAKKLTVPESAMLAAILNSPNYLSPERGARRPRRPDRALRLRAPRDGRRQGTLDAAEADKYYGKLPKLAKQQDQQHVRRPARLHADHGSRTSCAALGFDDEQIDSGGLRVETTFTRKAMEAAEDGVLEERPAGPEEAARRHGVDRRADRRADRLLRRPGLPAEPAELGEGGRVPGLVVQAVRPRGRTQGRVRAQGHLRRQRALRAARRRRRGRQPGRGQGRELRLGDQPDHRDRELREHRVRRPDHLDGGRAEEGGQDGHRARRPQERAGPRSRSRPSPWARPR